MRAAFERGEPPCGADLAEADLTGLDLGGADLWMANLKGACLRDARLEGAKLANAVMRGAELWGARLDGADLEWTDLSGADATTASFDRATLRNAKLVGISLNGARLEHADLSGADLWEAYLPLARLNHVVLVRANLYGAHLRQAQLLEANLTRANLTGADLSGANLKGASLWGADLKRAILVETNLEDADLGRCRVYGVAAWNVALEGAKQTNLIITRRSEPEIEVDELEVAQFVYLLLNNEKIRNVIDTVGKKAVLILGRFTETRKAVLDGIRDALRRHHYIPILFDFQKPAGRDLTETISTLAHLARFIVADITDAKSIPQELQAIVPDLPSVPVQLILAEEGNEYAMLEHFKRYPWVLPVRRYKSSDDLLANLAAEVIAPSEKKAAEVAPR